MAIVCPVIYEASSDSKKAIRAAISSGRPTRPSGIRLLARATISGGTLARKVGVPIIPGAMALHRTPRRANAAAMFLVRPAIAALDDPYADRMGSPWSPA